MKTRNLLAMFVLVAISAAHTPVLSQEKDEAAPAATADFKAIQVKLAETRLQLAEMELKLARDQNLRNAGLVPQVVIETLELSLAKAKAQLASVQDDKAAAQEAIAASADATLKIARSRFARLKQLGERSGTISKTDLERAEMRVTIAELERDSLKALFDQPIEQQLRWQVDRINSMIDGLSDRVIVLEDRR